MNRAVVTLVARGELQRLLRDRKAVLLALVLPVLLYPLLFWGSDRLGEFSEQRLEAQRSTIAADLRGLDADLAERLRSELGGLPTVEWEERELDRLEARLTATAADPLLARGEGEPPSTGGEDPSAEGESHSAEGESRSAEGESHSAEGESQSAEGESRSAEGDSRSAEGESTSAGASPGPRDEEAVDAALREAFEALEVDLALIGRPGDEGDPRPRLTSVFRAADEAGGEGSDRVRDVVAAIGEEHRAARFELLFGGDPAAALEAVDVDVASEADAAGLAIGKLLPLIAILVLIGGGAFAALEAFAAEREVGTLETLLVQPVSRLDLAYGKFAAVLLTATAAWIGNTLSFLGCSAAGLIGDVELGATSLGLLGGRVALGALVFLPTVLLSAAVLSLVSARARSYREGQNYLLPLTLVGGALAAPVAAGDLEFDAVLALAPVLGPSLAMRDALSGSLALLPGLVAVTSSLFYAAWALRRVGDTLDAERLLQGADVAAEAAERRIVGRRATVWGLAGVAGVLLVGSWLQSQALVTGLLLTLWGVVLGLALLAARDLGLRAGRSPRAVLALDAPGLGGVLGALLLGLGVAALMPHLFTLQQRFLPMPRMDSEAFEQLTYALLDQPLWLSLFLVALSPAVCEELLFRGAVLGGLRVDTPALRAVAVQALLFALAHGSVHRVLPTFLLGLVLGFVRLRTGSLVPCMLLHAAYNGSLVLAAGDGETVPMLDASSTLVLTLGGLIGAGLVWRARPGRPG